MVLINFPEYAITHGTRWSQVPELSGISTPFRDQLASLQFLFVSGNSCDQISVPSWSKTPEVRSLSFTRPTLHKTW